MPSLPNLWMQMWMTSLEMAQASTVTIAHRMPRLAATGLNPTPDGLLEAHRMVTEKMVAGFAGSMQAMDETGRLMVRAAFLQVDAHDVAKAMLSIPLAAAGPARRQVRANARRLSNGAF
jgi:hypothetical protein